MLDNDYDKMMSICKTILGMSWHSLEQNESERKTFYEKARSLAEWVQAELEKLDE